MERSKTKHQLTFNLGASYQATQTLRSNLLLPYLLSQQQRLKCGLKHQSAKELIERLDILRDRIEQSGALLYC